MDKQTTPRTLSLVTRLRALHPEFKPEWWLKKYCQCLSCSGLPEFDYIGPPDLLDRECLADLFEVCDLLFEEVESWMQKDNGKPVYGVKAWLKGISDYVFGPPSVTRSEALLAAVEAALGAGEECE